MFWKNDFDVALLDSLCLRHGLPLIPRKRVVCAMRLHSPLAGKWDAGRSATVDSADGTKLALERLHESQLGGFRCRFVSATRGRGTKWLADAPTPDKVVALALEMTAAAAGPGKLASQDLCRTLITAGLESGGHVRDLPEQAGHANTATTLRYAQASDARARKEKIQLPFA